MRIRSFVLRTFVRFFFYLEHCREAKRRQLLEMSGYIIAKVNETSSDENRNDIL